MFSSSLSFGMSFLLLAMFFLLVQGQSSSNNSTNRKECSRKKVDNCSSRLIMVSDRSFVFPENLEQMSKRCKELKPLEKCLKDYTTKCLPKSSSSTISVLAYGISRTNKGYCSNKRRKMSFAVIGKCANANKKKLEEISDKLVAEFYGIIGYKDSNLRIPLACCSYYRFKMNINDLINDKCKEHETEANALIDGFAHDILNLVCGEYTEESNKCLKLLDQIPVAKKSEIKTKSFIHPLAAIFESL